MLKDQRAEQSVIRHNVLVLIQRFVEKEGRDGNEIVFDIHVKNRLQVIMGKAIGSMLSREERHEGLSGLDISKKIGCICEEIIRAQPLYGYKVDNGYRRYYHDVNERLVFFLIIQLMLVKQETLVDSFVRKQIKNLMYVLSKGEGVFLACSAAVVVLQLAEPENPYNSIVAE